MLNPVSFVNTSNDQFSKFPYISCFIKKTVYNVYYSKQDIKELGRKLSNKLMKL